MRRNLGYVEAFNAILHEKVHGQGTVVLVAKLRAEIKLEQVKQAAAVAFGKHPMLRATLDHDNNALAFDFNAIIDDIPMCAIEHNDWQAVYQDELYRPFESHKYLWRISIMQADDDQPHSYIFLSCSHMIADGLSMTVLLNDILTLIDKGVLKEALKKQNDFIPPPIEQMLPAPKNAKKKAYDAGQIEKIKWPFAKNIPLLERRTGHIFLNFNEEFLNGLHINCRQRKVSINSALNAALLMAIHKKIPNGFRTSLCTPVDLRKYTKLDKNSFGCNSGMIFTEHSMDSEQAKFWDLAKGYQDIITDNINDVLRLPKEFSDADIMPLIDMCLDPDRDTFFMDFGITNLGRIDIDKTQADKIEFCYLSASRQAGDFVTLLCVLTVGNRLFIDFSYTEPLLEKKWMQSLADDFYNILSINGARAESDTN